MTVSFLILNRDSSEYIHLKSALRFSAMLRSFGRNYRGYLESFPAVLKVGNFDVLLPNFYFAARAAILKKWHLLR